MRTMNASHTITTNTSTKGARKLHRSFEIAINIESISSSSPTERTNNGLETFPHTEFSDK